MSGKGKSVCREEGRRERMGIVVCHFEEEEIEMLIIYRLSKLVERVGKREREGEREK